MGPGFFTRPAMGSNLVQVVYSHCLEPQSSQLQETGVQKVVFRLDRFNGLTN